MRVVHHGFGPQVRALEHQQGQNARVHQCRRQVAAAPARQLGEEQQEHRRQRPAQIARQPVGAEGVAQARRRHPVVEDAEVHRMKRRVAQAGEHRHQHQARVAVGEVARQASQDEAHERAEQHGPRAHLVDQETGHRLPGAGNDEEHRHQQAELRERQPEFGREHREQRRQQQVREVRAGMRQAHQADHFRVLAQRHDGQRTGGRGDGRRRHGRACYAFAARRARTRCGAGSHPGDLEEIRLQRPPGRRKQLYKR